MLKLPEEELQSLTGKQLYQYSMVWRYVCVLLKKNHKDCFPQKSFEEIFVWLRRILLIRSSLDDKDKNHNDMFLNIYNKCLDTALIIAI